MEEKDVKTELSKELENMYFANVIKGKYIKKGNFIALDQEGREFFANQGFVDKNINLFKILSDGIRPLWILVNEEVWRGKWNNRRVAKIVAMCESKKECEDYKSKLIQQLEIQMDLMDLHENHLKLIEDFYEKSFFEKEQKIIKEISICQKKLLELNTQLGE